MKPIFQTHQCLSEDNIKGYLGKGLSLEERHRVENHMLDCPLCTDAIDGYAMLQTDQDSAKGSGRREAPVRMLNWRFFSAAAAVLMLVVAVVWIFPGSSDNGQLFAEYYSPYDSDLDIHYRQAGENISPADTPLTLGLQAYTDKDYETSITHLETFLIENPDHLVSRFYLAQALIEAGRESEAMPQMEAVKTAQQEYWEEASWYLTLLYVKSDRIEDAKEVLNTLIEPGSGRYFEEAKKLFKKL